MRKRVRTFPRSRSWLLAGTFMVAGSVALPTELAAQTVAPTREEIQRGLLEETLKREGQQLSIEGDVPRGPCPLAAPEFADIRFTLREARFTGAADVDQSLLTDSYSSLIGQELPVSAVCDIRDRASASLRSSGYLAAVQVPPQTIEDGVVRFDVVLARMTQVQVRGEAGPSEPVLQRYLQKLIDQPVFNIEEAERYLLLARDIPGLDVRLTLRPLARSAGGQPGDVVGEFNVVRTPFAADINIQNFGSEEVGRFGGLSRVRVNGLTGLGDETILSFFSTADFKEQLVFQGSHNFIVGSEGLNIGTNFTFARTRPDVPGLDFDSETIVAGVSATYPFVRTQSRNIFGTIGYEYIDQRTDFTNLPLNLDKLSIAYARLDFNQIDGDSVVGNNGYSAVEPKLAVAGSIEIRQGLDIFGASEGCGPNFVRCAGFNPVIPVPPARIDGDPTAFVLRGQAQIDYRPTPLLKFSLKPRFQWSDDALFSYEEFSGGNYTVGRGFDPGAVIGDSGYGLQTEISYGSLIPQTPGGNAFQPYVFFDFVGVYNKNIAGDPQRIYSGGGGVRATLGRQASLDVVAVVPFNRAPLQTRRNSARALVTLTVQLVPWFK